MNINWKMVGRAVLGGGITAALGAFVLPYANQILSFVPQYKILIQGLTPHALAAYGLGFWAADFANEKLLKN